MECNNIDLSDYEVVSSCLISGNEDPAVSLFDGRITANRWAIEALPENDYIQFLAAREKRTLVIRPKPKGTKDSFRWVTGGKRRSPRRVKCVPVFYLIFCMMGWDFECRYKVYGTLHTSEDESVLLFDLNKYEKYKPDAKSGRIKNNPQYAQIFEESFGTKAPEHDEEERNGIKVYEDVVIFEVALKETQKHLPDMKTEEPDGTE